MATNGATDPAAAPPSAREDDSSDGVTTAKPLLATVDNHEVEKRDAAAGAAQEQPGRRFWIRPLVLILIPIIITVYYGVIWVALVQNVKNDEAAKYRHYSGSLIFYSWFIIGVSSPPHGKKSTSRWMEQHTANPTPPRFSPSLGPSSGSSASRPR